MTFLPLPQTEAVAFDAVVEACPFPITRDRIVAHCRDESRTITPAMVDAALARMTAAGRIEQAGATSYRLGPQ